MSAIIIMVLILACLIGFWLSKKYKVNRNREIEIGTATGTATVNYAFRGLHLGSA